MLNELLHMPLFWAMLTIAAFTVGQHIYRLLGNTAFLPPILTGIILVSVVLEVTGISFDTYMEGGQYLHLMLGPVVVMLAVPLYQFIHVMKKEWLRISLAISLGSGTTVAVAVAIAASATGASLAIIFVEIAALFASCDVVPCQATGTNTMPFVWSPVATNEVDELSLSMVYPPERMESLLTVAASGGVK